MRITLVAAAAGLALAAVATTQTSWAARRTAFSAVKMIIEYNSSAQDIGVQFFLDSEGWQTVSIFDPNGQQIYQAAATGILLEQGGGTEMFVESVEPPLTKLPLDVFFARFPEGSYRFVGHSPSGDRLMGTAQFSHRIPAGPVIVAPAQNGGCPQVAGPVVIDWNDVTTSIDGAPLDIVGYEVIVERVDRTLDVKFPAAETKLTVPPEFLQAGTQYAFEILAIERGGNQTITEGCFTTPK